MSEQSNPKRSQLSATKQALLAQRLKGKKTTGKKSESQQPETANSLPQIVPDRSNRHLPFPLTDMQQAYWIGRNSFFESGNVSIHAYFETDSQNLDLQRFNRAWQRLIDRHDMLRAIVLPNGQQQILENLPPYEIKVLDLRGKSEEVVAAELQAVRDRLSHQVLPSDRWPLYEIYASQLGDRHYRLHISIDGIFFDARSYQILSKELIQLYQDPDCELPPLELSFRDYVQASIDLQTSEIYQRSLDYWQHRIPTLPPAPELPLANTGETPPNPKFVRRRATLDAQLWQKLKTRAGRSNVTPAGLLLAVYAEVLATWSKSPHFTINVPRFDRFPLHPQVNQTIGEFASFTLLEADFSERLSFEVRAKRLQQQLWQDLEHQYVSGVRVLRELARYQGNTLGVTMPIVFTSSPQDVSGKETAKIDAPVDLGAIAYSLSQTPQVWMDFMYHESNGSLIFNIDAVEERFAPGVVEAMFRAYDSLLNRLAEDDRAWQETERSLVPESQLQQRAAINANDAPIPDKTLYQLFCDRVEEAPQQVAVTTSDRTLTYEEVYRRSQHLGYRLRELGARPNTLVAVWMEKGWEQIVAVLGILAAGAAYLPLDPELPQERLEYLLQDAGVQQVLTQSKLLLTRTLPDGIQTICVDGQDLSNANPAPLPSVNAPEDLAYVIYTSGSTGLPKGVAIGQRGAVNAIAYTNQRFNITASDRAIALTALHHDMSVFDIFGILAAGGTLAIPDAAARRDPAHWAQLLQRERVTIWNSVPAMMEMLLEYTTSHAQLEFPDLRLTFLGGDWIPVTLPDRLQEIAPNVQLVSVGGPTETTLWNICYPLEAIAPNSKSIPYGKPIANTRYYILNDALEDRPVWVPGQMYCAGVGLAQGYWGNEEKTRENFITHPHTGERLYRTGDMGRYLSDGNIEFIGRADFQVKIRGHRIEPGEIEAAIAKHPAVRSAVVVAVGDRAENKQLVAYVVPEEASHPELAEELRHSLSEKLPPYMVPATVMLLESLPLTSNGKVDRRGLPTPEHLDRSSDTFIAPRTAIEEKIAGIWQEVLNCDRIGIRDNFFFDLGGHSLLATQVMSRVRDAFALDLSLRDLFAVPTVAGLAQQIVRATEEDAPIVNPDTVDFQAESILDPNISPVGNFQFNPAPARILLTGVTGFLGAFLLHDLLQKTQAEIYCLVRAANAVEAKKRIQSNLETYGVWSDRLGERMIPLVGDLAQPQLGLSAQQFQALAHQIDVIYHNGALVNFTYPYSAIKAANVQSTLEVLKLAGEVKLKPLHFISTVGVFSSTATSKVEEDDKLGNIDHLEGGYVQSKWVAEQLLMAARDRGFPINIYRPGRITGHSQTGACNINDFVHRIIQGCIQLGSAPNWNNEVEMVPVDYVSGAIVHLSLQAQSIGKNFHLVNSQTLPWSEFVTWVRSQGYPLERVSYPEWREQLYRVAAHSNDNALYPLLSVFSNPGSSDRTSTVSQLDIGDRHTKHELQETDISCPPVGHKLLTTYFSYLVRCGYLPEPQQHPQGVQNVGGLIAKATPAGG